jgi:hypothetical protein
MRYRDMTRPRHRSRHRVSTLQPLVFILAIAMLLLITIMFVPGPREVIAAISHTVSHRLNPVRPSNSPSQLCNRKRCLSPSTSMSALCTTSAVSGSCGLYTYPQISGINGQVTVGNNVWSPISGWSQTLNANNPGDWSVTANMPVGNTSVVSYPNVGTTVPWLPNTDVNPKLSSWSSMYSSWNVNIAGDANSGSMAEAGYDIWLNNWNNEVMIQTDFVGDSLRPRCDVNGDVIATVPFGGSNGVPVQSWNLCQFGSELIWQLPTGTNDPTGSVDVMAMLTWLETRGSGKYLPANSSLTGLSFGFEICSTGKQNETFQLNSFTLTATPS